jgi:hypothetical protein
VAVASPRRQSAAASVLTRLWRRWRGENNHSCILQKRLHWRSHHT